MRISNISNHLNSTARRAEYDNVEDLTSIVMQSLMTVVHIVAFIGNLAIFIVIPRISGESIKAATKVYCMGHALTDLLAAIIHIVGQLSEWIGRWVGWTYGSSTFCTILGFLTAFFPGISILQIMFVNVNRYLLIMKPMIYPRISMKRRALVTSVTLTILNLLVQFLFVYFSKISFEIVRYHSEIGGCLIDFGDPSFFPFSVILFAVGWLNMLLLIMQYCRIIRVSLSHKQKIKFRVQSPSQIASNEHRIPPQVYSIPKNFPEDETRSARSEYSSHQLFLCKVGPSDVHCPSQRSDIQIVIDALDSPNSSRTSTSVARGGGGGGGQ